MSLKGCAIVKIQEKRNVALYCIRNLLIYILQCFSKRKAEVKVTKVKYEDSRMIERAYCLNGDLNT